ncbi:DUF5667 domain-containing protein [Ectobacillus sp. JY-23]|uniref:DUF5667 domain-containing protein n=1 Tax=Ectobacillus sp. JY-23 TaxID=2933872 RepID=UPI001FF3C448|nr:DUF5667 domain-containing protein [Ectobacillus sp. JY-23]UOY93921.1 DUF5667 domain-containing protein [Ectobacillus sp. JY-23]
MKNVFVKGTMTTMLLCSPFLAGTAYADTDTEKTTEEAPTLVQGDFFYFIKTMMEDIRLALATNDLDKAKLLSEQAAERIAEARVLIQEGKDNYTQDTLKEAADKLEKADELAGEDTEKSPSETDKLIVVEDDASDKTEEEATETEKPATEKEKVKIHIGHNIEALAKVLDKVKNPKAKAAIAKNIEKSFVKLADKIEKKQAKQELVIIGESKQEQIETKPEESVDVQVMQSEQEQETVTTPAQPAPAVPATPAQPAQRPVKQVVQKPEHAQGSKEKKEHHDNGQKHGHEKKEQGKQGHEKHQDKQ